MGQELAVTKEFIDAGQFIYRDRMLQHFQPGKRVTSNGNLPSVPAGWEGEVVEVAMPFTQGRTTNIIRVKWDNFPQIAMDMKSGDLEPFLPLPKMSRVEQVVQEHQLGTTFMQSVQHTPQERTGMVRRLFSWLPGFDN